jgi:hypothetical protein
MRTVVVLMGLLLLAACRQPEADAYSYAEVIDRDFIPEHEVHHPGHWRDGGEDCGYEYVWVDGGYEYVSGGYEYVGGEYVYVEGGYEYVSGGYENEYICEDRPDIWVPAWDETIEDEWVVTVTENQDGEDGDYEDHEFSVTEEVYDNCTIGRQWSAEVEECVSR